MGGTDTLIQLVRRSPLLSALREGPLDRRDIEARLDVSKPTVHRATKALTERGFVERDGSVFRLTRSGRVVAEAAEDFRRTATAADRLAPLLHAIDDADPTFDVAVEPFADARVTCSEPGHPYRPLNRFMTLVRETDRLRGFDTTTVAPGNVATIHERIVDGMVTEILYPPGVVEDVLGNDPERAREAVESGNLTLGLHESLPCGLALFDDRVGLGGYDAGTGTLSVFVDTDDPEAYAWGERTFERYRAAATPLTATEG
ncbi:helix-turn-helix transcriptional regulator [Halomarina litorea]|uniref:helix-turn-helix transcriptional regulator n=1 Tax=Halomarina litorea TaxID=2961595 RepID=UPI0020C1D332|nr:helix-turn-helix domain-containing protein [Halomarina sp. BCD28]